MPCQFFEPVVAAANAEYSGARLPLLEQYAGHCRAQTVPIEAPAELLFRCCNHGYSRRACPHFPQHAPDSAIRFDVLAADDESLSVLYVEEREYAPFRWQKLRYVIAAGTVEPELPDDCARAQVRAFCLSFLRQSGQARS